MHRPSFRAAGRVRPGGGVRCALLAPIAAISLGLSAGSGHAQIAPMAYDEIPLAIDSGAVQWEGPGAVDAAPQVVFSQVVGGGNARWVRLEFGIAQLAGSIRDGTNSYLEITSLKDGGAQHLDALSIVQWDFRSAFLNGNAVLVELFAYPGTGPNRVSIVSMLAGQAEPDGPETQCGPFDNRTPSSHPWSARLAVPGDTGFCTAFLFQAGSGTNPTCFLAAGHCFPQSGDIVEFNVPYSNPDGTVNFAAPQDQYPVDPASVQLSNGFGNDWAFFGCFPNSNTGQFAGQVQGAGFTIVSTVPATDNSNLDMWGYGLESSSGNFPYDPTYNKIQQYEDGTYDTLESSVIVYDDLDTMGANSGSPIYKTNIGAVIGIHTNGGCSTSGSGSNFGTRIDRPVLQSAIENPLGICNATSGPCPSPDSCFYVHSVPGCNDTVCCNQVCALDSFCCDISWDQACVNQANEFCGDTDCPSVGSCYVVHDNPACNHTPCCNTVCIVDSFCCNVTWDGLCRAEAFDLCLNAPPAGACCLPDYTCQDLVEPAECEALGGVYQGDDTTCATTDCFPDCPSPGNCFVAHGFPGCNDDSCCQSVCLVDPFCCDSVWDGFCADQATDICGFTECPGGGGCFSTHAGVGCNDEVCCNTVCLIDPFCCTSGWDGLCVDEALQLCEGAPCDLPCPPGAITESEGCGADTNGGCNSTPPAFNPAVCGNVFCGTAWADGGTRDTDWYLVEHGGGPISARLTSQFPGVCFIVDGIATCDPVVVGSIGCSSDCDPVAIAVADLPPGTYAVFVSLGDCAGGAIGNGYPCGSLFTHYTLEISCTPPATCPCDFDNDGDVDVDDLLFLLANWGGPGGDCNGDNITDVNDLLALLAQWGPC